MRRLVRRTQVWAVSLVLTLLGVLLAVGVFAVAVAFGAPAASAVAFALGAGLIIAVAIGIVLRWLADE